MELFQTLDFTICTDSDSSDNELPDLGLLPLAVGEMVPAEQPHVPQFEIQVYVYIDKKNGLVL